MQQSPPNIYSVSWEVVSHILRNPGVRDSVHKIPPLVPILVHTLEWNFFEINFDIIIV
jgi:hypothetical protein